MFGRIFSRLIIFSRHPPIAGGWNSLVNFNREDMLRKVMIL